jgi:hypothetical protein
MKHNSTLLEEMLAKSHYFENSETISVVAAMINSFMQPLVESYQPVKRVLTSPKTNPLLEAARSAGSYVASLD